MKKALVVIVVIAVVAVGAFMLAGRGGGSRTLGQPVPEGSKSIKIADAVKQVNQSNVTVTGKIGQKCPTAGCWFYIEDGTGSIRVDTQFAGFNVLDVPSGSKVTVHGKVLHPEDGEPEVSALGMKIER